MNVLGFPQPPVSAPMPGSGYISGAYCPAFRLAGSNGLCTINVLYAFPFDVETPTEFDALVFDSLGTAGSFFRIGMLNSYWGRPDKIVVDSGQISAAGSGKNVYPFRWRAPRGRTWLVGVGQIVNPSVARVGGYADERIQTSDPYSVAFGGMGYQLAGVTGAIPSAWGGSFSIITTASSSPAMWLRVR